jgi:hypothetical protein
MMRAGLAAITAALLGYGMTFPGTTRGPGARQASVKVEEVVKIEFPKEGYTFTLAEAAKGVKISYKVIVEQDCPGVIALPHAPSFHTPAGPSGLHPLEKIADKENLYCLLDFGLGAPPKEVVKTVKKGTYVHSFEWDGRNWTGPSDFSRPKGKPFPAGAFELTVSLRGKVLTDGRKKPYEITKTARLVLK